VTQAGIQMSSPGQPAAEGDRFPPGAAWQAVEVRAQSPADHRETPARNYRRREYHRWVQECCTAQAPEDARRAQGRLQDAFARKSVSARRAARGSVPVLLAKAAQYARRFPA